MGLISRVSSRTYRNLPWFSESNTDADWHGTPALTSERSVRLQVESSSSSTPESVASLPSAVTPARSSRELRPTEPPSFSQAEPPDDLRPSPEPTGGCVSANALKRRITRAFLIEEQKIVIKVMKAQQEA